MTSFKDLKKNRSQAAETLKTELTKSEYVDRDDKRYWRLTKDKTGTGYAVIRFLPAPANEDLPYVKMFQHSFKGPGGQWYIEKSRTTLGEADPVSELNSKLWNSGRDVDKKLVSDKQKRKTTYISNILVVSDPANPENEGKVFLFSYGKKIFEKGTDMLTPEFEDEKPVNIFDMWDGANLKLKVRQVDGFPNYDKSEFEAPSAIDGDDKRLEEIWNSQYSLTAEVAPDKFKSFDALKARLSLVTAGGVTTETETAEIESEEEEVEVKTTRSSRRAPAASDNDEDDFIKSLGDKAAKKKAASAA